ncbi:MAG: ABC transporter ATP-binding protein [Thermoplasmata archaeon]|nr:ABC transporter ATP-binding protein [Thermoplasmata archaeon]
MHKEISVDVMGELALIADSVSKVYDGNVEILRDVDLEVAKGEMILLWGRNGSGKTTLLNLLGCMDTPTKGRILVDGQDTSRLSQKQLARLRLRQIGYVFQSHNLIEDLTVRENVYLPLRIAKSKNAEQRVKSLLKTFGIDALSRKRPNEISGGESQKAAICRALANNPSVMLADEPTASLDSESCGIVLDAFKMIRENFDTTIVVASHDPLLYDHIEKKYFLFDGRLKTEPKEV